MNISKTKGFTLVELMISVAIVVVLTAIVVSNFGSAKAKSRDAKRVSDILQIQLALEGYLDRCGQYPVILATDGSTGCPSGVNLGTFISQIPKSPTLPDYVYSVKLPDGSDYVLKAVLETTSNVLNDTYTGNVALGYTPSMSACSKANKEYCVVPR